MTECKPLEFGHCACCGCEIVDIVDGQPRHKPNYCEVQFLLANGSKMRIAFCAPCRHDRLPGMDLDALFEHGVHAGWKREAQQLVKLGRWTPDHARSYLMCEALSGGIVRRIV